MTEKITYSFGVWKKNAKGQYVKVGTEVYNFWCDDNKLYVEHNDVTKSMQVVDDSEFVVKLQKKIIYAHNGAQGLSKWMKKCVDDNFQTCWVEKICYWVIYRKQIVR